jgi:hypothetical protein
VIEVTNFPSGNAASAQKAGYLSRKVLLCGASLHDRTITVSSQSLAVMLITFVRKGVSGLDFLYQSDMDSHLCPDFLPMQKSSPLAFSRHELRPPWPARRWNGRNAALDGLALGGGIPVCRGFA